MPEDAHPEARRAAGDGAADAAAAKDAEEKIARGHRIDAATRQFESSVSEIVETVSSASTELEASAGTLTKTAEHAQTIKQDMNTLKVWTGLKQDGNVWHAVNAKEFTITEEMTSEQARVVFEEKVPVFVVGLGDPGKFRGIAGLPPVRSASL